MQGFRLVDGNYEMIPADAEGGVASKELGIRFILEDGNLAMFDAATGERLLTHEEWKDRLAEEEKRRAEEEKRLRELAEQRAKALEEEIARLKKSTGRTNDPKRKNGKS